MYQSYIQLLDLVVQGLGGHSSYKTFLVGFKYDFLVSYHRLVNCFKLLMQGLDIKDMWLSVIFEFQCERFRHLYLVCANLAARGSNVSSCFFPPGKKYGSTTRKNKLIR